MENRRLVTEEELRKIVVGQYEIILDITASFEAMVSVLKENGSLLIDDLALARRTVDQSTKHGKSRELLRELRDSGSIEDFLRVFQGPLQ